MLPGLLTDPLPLVVIGIAVAVLAWDVSMAGWIAARREAPRLFTQLTVVCGLLVVPVLVINVASGTESGARTISGITWLVPAVTIAFALQVLYAVLGRLISLVVGLPILLYDLLLAATAVGDYLVTQRGGAPTYLQALLAARDAIVGMGVGRAALVSPLTALVPMIAPAYPARWRLSGAVRAVLVLAATALTTLLIIEWPRGIGAVRSYERAYTEPMQARPSGDFVLGVRLYPTLDGMPPARAVRNDAAIVEAFTPDVVLLVLDDDGTRSAALDSLARVLGPLRDDSVQIAVALRLDRTPPAADDADRQLSIERVLQRLEPDVLFPALPDPVPTWIGSTAPSAAWWQRLLRRSSSTVQRVRPRTVLGWAAARLDATDSATYAWARQPSNGVELVGAMSFPSFSGLPAVDARLRAFERWHDAAAQRGLPTMPHWLVNVGGLPRAHGDAAQVAAIRHALAWGSRRPWIGAAIVGEPADYDGWLGLRASNGRPRAALAAIGAAARRMKEVRAGN
ncbi:MAG: hypothetical protein K2R93_21185 [Gemmatimonadaceae bacterium]|nr:hypothetical protein [Gemmatimonadaceae bacterium]